MICWQQINKTRVGPEPKEPSQALNAGPSAATRTQVYSLGDTESHNT